MVIQGKDKSETRGNKACPHAYIQVCDCVFVELGDKEKLE